MEEAKISPGAVVVIGLGLGGIAVLGLAALAFAKPAEGIPLYAGWNEVVYTGPTKKAGIALESIMDYLVIVYYYDAFQGIWIQVVYDTILEPDQRLNIQVTEDCIWTF